MHWAFFRYLGLLQSHKVTIFIMGLIIEYEGYDASYETYDDAAAAAAADDDDADGDNIHLSLVSGCHQSTKFPCSSNCLPWSSKPWVISWPITQPMAP